MRMTELVESCNRHHYRTGTGRDAEERVDDQIAGSLRNWWNLNHLTAKGTESTTGAAGN
jgi:hypothetical protein